MSELSERERAIYNVIGEIMHVSWRKGVYGPGESDASNIWRLIQSMDSDAWVQYIACVANLLDRTLPPAPPAALTWSDEAPTEPGPYLWKDSYGSVYGVTVTAFHFRPDEAPTYRFRHPNSGRDIYVRTARGRWSGPIPLPEVGE